MSEMQNLLRDFRMKSCEYIITSGRGRGHGFWFSLCLLPPPPPTSIIFSHTLYTRLRNQLKSLRAHDFSSVIKKNSKGELALKGQCRERTFI